MDCEGKGGHAGAVPGQAGQVLGIAGLGQPLSQATSSGGGRQCLTSDSDATTMSDAEQNPEGWHV